MDFFVSPQDSNKEFIHYEEMQGMFVIPPPPGEIQMYYMNMMMMRKKKKEALKRILSSKELNEPHIETNGEMMKYLLDTEIAQNFIHEFHDNHTIRPESPEQRDESEQHHQDMTSNREKKT